MKYLRYLVGSAITLVALFASIPFINATEVKPIKFDISFRNPLSVEQVSSFIDQYKLETIYYKSTFDTGYTTTTDFYFPKSGIDILKDYTDSRRGYILDTIQTSEAIAKSGNEDLKDMAAQKAETMRRALKDGSDIQITGIMAYGDPGIDIRIAKSPLVLTVYSESTNTRSLALTSPLIASINKFNFISLNNLGWIPTSGTSVVNPSTLCCNLRFSQQYAKWSSISGFSSTSAYEHDFWLNNYDNKTYLDTSQDSSGFPIVNYAGSDLPQPYLDTRWGDIGGEKSYVVGTPYPNKISINTLYNTYIRTNKGNTATDTGKLQAQLGYRVPTCISTWCINSSQTVNLIKAWNITVPGMKNWSY